MIRSTQFNKLLTKICLILFCCYIPLAISKDKPYTETEARQCSDHNNCERIRANAKKHAQNWCSDDGGVDRIEGFSSCKQDGTFCQTSGHIYCKGKSTLARGWYGCSNCKTPTDRENDLNSKIGGFSRKVPTLKDNATWKDLCSSIGKKCVQVKDWEGTPQSCNDWALDGSRAALCEDK